MKKIISMLLIMICSILFISCDNQKKVQTKKVQAIETVSEKGIIDIKNEYNKVYIDNEFNISDVNIKKFNINDSVQLNDGFIYKVDSIKKVNEPNKLLTNNEIINLSISITNTLDKEFQVNHYIYRLIYNNDVIKPILINSNENLDSIKPNETKQYDILFEIDKKAQNVKIGMDEKYLNIKTLYLSNDEGKILNKTLVTANNSKVEINKEKDRIDNIINTTIQKNDKLNASYDKRNNDINNYINAIYRKGDTGEDIKLIQNKLAKFKYPIEVNGIFDEKMESYIKDFQSRSNLNADGIVGIQTRNELNKEPSDANCYIPPRSDFDKMNDAEKFINSNDFYSETNYYIYVDSDTHLVNIFTGSNKNWTISKQFICSMGKDSTPTIRGTFLSGDKGLSFGQDEGFTCKYWTRISGGYLFHSVLYDVTGEYIIDGTLGANVSHGCIRLDVENAKWIYDNIPANTTIYIK